MSPTDYLAGEASHIDQETTIDDCTRRLDTETPPEPDAVLAERHADVLSLVLTRVVILLDCLTGDTAARDAEGRPPARSLRSSPGWQFERAFEAATGSVERMRVVQAAGRELGRLRAAAAEAAATPVRRGFAQLKAIPPRGRGRP